MPIFWHEAFVKRDKGDGVMLAGGIFFRLIFDKFGMGEE